jgi:hypothetical protein
MYCFLTKLEKIFFWRPFFIKRVFIEAINYSSNRSALFPVFAGEKDAAFTVPTANPVLRHFLVL